MSDITRLPPFQKKVHVKAEIPTSQLDEFNHMMTALSAGDRPRMDALERDVAAIRIRAMAALKIIEAAINDHPTSGQAGRLVRFPAGVYNGSDYPFDLTDLRTLDTALANACMDYLNYDRLCLTEVHKHLENGDRDLHRWFEQYRIEPKST